MSPPRRQAPRSGRGSGIPGSDPNVTSYRFEDLASRPLEQVSSRMPALADQASAVLSMPVEGTGPTSSSPASPSTALYSEGSAAPPEMQVMSVPLPTDPRSAVSSSDVGDRPFARVNQSSPVPQSTDVLSQPAPTLGPSVSRLAEVPVARRGGGGGGAVAAAQRTAAQNRAEYRAAGQAPEDTFSIPLAEREGRINETRAQGLESQSSVVGQQNAAAQQAEAARQARMQQAEADIDRRISEVENMRVDPNNWFSSRGVVGSIGAAIAVGLGAAAQSLQGNGPNNALGIINSAIDRDIAAQNENMRNAGMRLSNRENALGRLRQQFGDQRSAEEAFRARSLMIAENQVNAMMSRAQTPTQQEALAQTAQSLQAAREGHAANIRAHQLQLTAQQDAAAIAAAQRAAGAGRRRELPATSENLAQRDNFYRSLVSNGMSAEEANARTAQAWPIAGLGGIGNVTPVGSGATVGNQARVDAIVGLDSLARDLDAGADVAGTGLISSAAANTDGLTGVLARGVANTIGNGTQTDPRLTAAIGQFNEILKNRSGGAVTEAESVRANAELGNLVRPQTRTQLRQQINVTREAFARLEAAERAAAAANGGVAPRRPPTRR